LWPWSNWPITPSQGRIRCKLSSYQIYLSINKACMDKGIKIYFQQWWQWLIIPYKGEDFNFILYYNWLIFSKFNKTFWYFDITINLFWWI
jgi:hypothetical protein